MNVRSENLEATAKKPLQSDLLFSYLQRLSLTIPIL